MIGEACAGGLAGTKDFANSKMLPSGSERDVEELLNAKTQIVELKALELYTGTGTRTRLGVL